MISGLESARLKLDRAAVHIEAVRKAIGDYLSSEPGGIAKDADGKYRLSFRKLPPPEAAVLAGEAIYQMRSALDHLACDLVKLNPSNIQLPRDWVNDCQFPLRTKIPATKNASRTLPLPYNSFARRLPGISKEAFEFIEGMQPYYDRCDREGSTQLLYLAKLSNIDKHRHLHVTKPRADVRYDWINGEGLHHCTTIRIENGADVEIPVPKGAKVKAGFTPFVSFDESGLSEGETGLTVCGLLGFCLDGVERFIIPKFSELLKNP